MKNRRGRTTTLNRTPARWGIKLPQRVALAGILLAAATWAQAQSALLPGLTESLDRAAERALEDTGELVREVEPALRTPLTEHLATPLPDTLPANLSLPVVELGTLPPLLNVIDPQGETALVEVQVEDGWRAVQRQWLAVLAPGEMKFLRQLNAEIVEQRQLAELGLQMVRFRVPAALDSRAALAQRLPAELVPRLDRNHIYRPQDGPNARDQSVLPRSSSLCEQRIKIGMVDTGIDLEHSSLAQAHIVEREFASGLSADGNFTPPRAHGTAVAGLLVSAIDARPPRLPGATLYNASVFYRRNAYAQGATMMHLLKGLNWLLEQDVSVINMSLTGPDNRVLAAAIARVLDSGTAVVAAAGNEGPAAPALYPAAYPPVIAATAVDGQGQIYRWANRGDYIDFAAPGVSVQTTRSESGFGRESGTSMAAPVVSAHLACSLAEGEKSVEIVVQGLADKAEDLGEPGRDPVFGYGLLR